MTVALCSPRSGKQCREGSRRHAGGRACPQLDVPHSQAGTEMGAAVSIMNVKVFFCLSEVVGCRRTLQLSDSYSLEQSVSSQTLA